MTISDLVKTISNEEGKVSEVSVGNIREIVGIISDILAEDIKEESEWNTSVLKTLVKNGQRRAKK